MSATTELPAHERPDEGLALGAVAAAAGLLVAATAWAYAPTLTALARIWEREPDYSHGWLIVPAVGYLLWARRERRPTTGPTPSLWGLGLLAAGMGARWLGAYYFLTPLEHLSLVVWALGLVLLVGGWPWLRWSWGPLLFLVFLFPLPFRLETYLSEPLRHWAAGASGWLLDLLGQPVVQTGVNLRIGDFDLEVAAACSGLRMIVSFLALSVGYVLLAEPPRWQAIVLLLAALPIALICNVLRITATGLAFQWIGPDGAHALAHDGAGWAMMPVAILILAGLQMYLDALLPAAKTTPTASPPAAAMPAASVLRWGCVVGLGATLTLASGVVVGVRTDRWGVDDTSQQLARRLDAFPRTLGEWHAVEDRELAPVAREILEPTAVIERTYQSTVDGSRVELLLMLGPAGPLSLHGPDVCYAGAGYVPEAAPQRAELPSLPWEGWTVTLGTPDEYPPVRFRATWSWHDEAGWSAPEGARFHFAGRPRLWKLQLLTPAADEVEGGRPDAVAARFLRAFVPAFSDMLTSPEVTTSDSPTTEGEAP